MAGFGRVPVTELVAEHLLPLADEGLAGLGLRREVRNHYLDVIAERCRSGQNGASWQVACTEHFQSQGADRPTALHQMFALYVEHMEDNKPVHTWEVPSVSNAVDTETAMLRP